MGTFTYSTGAESSSTPSSEDDISKTTTPGPSDDITEDATSSYSTTREAVTEQLIDSEVIETSTGVTNTTTVELLVLTTTVPTTAYSSSTYTTSPSSLEADDPSKVFFKAPQDLKTESMNFDSFLRKMFRTQLLSKKQLC